jgi:methylenetetrahydrofolate reductase (NADPH)
MPDRKRTFNYTFELLPARASKGRALDELIRFAEQAASDGILHALSITDNAGGHPALSPLALGREIADLGIEPIIHFSCKDKNRNTLESQLLELDRAGLHKLMVITGDYPGPGFRGRAKPVFDLDSVQALDLVREMNRPGKENSQGQSPWKLETAFTAGCVVSSFKKTEAEQAGQYLKLAKKLEAGACFIVSQMGFDIRKFQELLIVKNMLAEKIPLYATVFVPDIRLARLIRKGAIPGCTIPARILMKMEKEACETRAMAMKKGIERAARLVALLRGIGFDGVHLSGYQLDYQHVRSIIKQADEYAAQWRTHIRDFIFPEEWNWMLFEQDKETGLNIRDDGKGILQILRSLPGKYHSPLKGVIFSANSIMHNMFFERDKGAYGICRRFSEKLERSSTLQPFTSFEHFIKGILYDCRHCGDCYLDDNAFLCPHSQCAKFLVNGPCGGSNNGWCEVWPGKKRCIYVRIYERVKETAVIKTLSGPILPPRDWNLDSTSSWLNFYLGKDHSAAKGD